MGEYRPALLNGLTAVAALGEANGDLVEHIPIILAVDEGDEEEWWEEW